MGTILSGLMTIGVTVRQAGGSWGGEGLPLPWCTYCTCVPFCIFWGRDTFCIIVEVGAGKWGGDSSNNHSGLGNLFIGSGGQRTGDGWGCSTLLMQLLFILLFTWEINGFSHTSGPRVFLSLDSGVSLRLALSREYVLPAESSVCGAQGLKCLAGLMGSHHLYTAY